MNRTIELIHAYTATALAIGALLVVSYIAIATSNEVAIGALIGTSTSAGSWFLRGRVQNPTP